MNRRLSVDDPPRQTFPKDRRVVRGREFGDAIRRGSVAADGTLVVFVMAAAPDRGGPSAPSRMGVTVPKKTGHAVCRNRWKRWVREAFRTQVAELPAGIDIVVRPKKGAAGSWKAVNRSLPKLVLRATEKLRREPTKPPAPTKVPTDVPPC